MGRVVGLIFSLSAFLLTVCCSAATELEVGVQPFENSLRPTILLDNQPTPGWTLSERMKYHNIPGVAVAVIEDGKLVSAKGYGVLSISSTMPVTSDTVFSVGSVSKVVTAIATLELYEQGILGLDTPVKDYLKSWRIPENGFTQSKPPTLRMILSHTAGFSVHGFEDYFDGEDIPNTLDILNGSPPAKNDPVEIIFEPGSQRKYSGGGVTIEQLVLSDVTNTPFDQLLQETVLQPNGMKRSTFTNPLLPTHGNIAKAHDEAGQAVGLPSGIPVMPEMAASGLWTSVEDLGKLVSTLIKNYRSPNGFLEQETVAMMMTEVAPSYNGLGPRIDQSHAQISFNHPGANDNYRAWIEGNLETGDGLVVLTNGTNGFALITEIRNAVADNQGWANNFPIDLSGLAIPEDIRQTLKDMYVLDDSYPTALQGQIKALSASEDLTISLVGDKLVLKAEDVEVILPLYHPH